MKTIIHVNQHVIKSNNKNNENEPPLTVKTHKDNTKAHKVRIYDQDGQTLATVVYSPDKPLDCGARVWIETNHFVDCQ